jgi:biotin operon repressor
MSDLLEYLALQKDLPARTIRVCLYMASRCNSEDWGHVPQSEIAETLDIDRANVNRAVQQLLDAGILLKGPKNGRSYFFRFNPDLAGKHKARRKNASRSGFGSKNSDPSRDELEAMGQQPLPLES